MKQSFMDIDFEGQGGGGFTGIPEMFAKPGENELIFLSDPVDLSEKHDVPPIETFYQYSIDTWNNKFAYEEGDPADGEHGYHPDFDPTTDSKTLRGVAYVFNLTAYRALKLGEIDSDEEEAWAKDKYLSKDENVEKFTGLMRFELNALVSKDLQATIAKLQQKSQKAGIPFTLKDHIITVRRTGSGKNTTYSVFKSGNFSDLDQEIKDQIMSVARPRDDKGERVSLPDLSESHIAWKKYGAKNKRDKKREEGKQSSNGKKPRRAGKTIVDDDSDSMHGDPDWDKEISESGWDR